MSAVHTILLIATVIPSSVPDQYISPGRLNYFVTQENLQETVCKPGWNEAQQPPPYYMDRIKRLHMVEYGYSYTGLNLSDFEEDHRVPISVGGAPGDPHNMWPEPHVSLDGWNSYKKVLLGTRVWKMLCSGQLTLAQARAVFLSDWREAYKLYVGE